MTSSLFPADGSHVEMDLGGRTLPQVRVVRVTDATVTLSLARADVPLTSGSPVTIRWPAGSRGRYAQHGTVVRVDENRIDVTLPGEPEIEQQRLYVRGGGGEAILLVRADKPQVTGRVHDISEQSVRAHFSDVDLRPGDQMLLRVQLGSEVVEFPATALRVSSLRQQVPVRGPVMVEMVAIFDRNEHQAKIIRRYVFRLQTMARREAAAAEAMADEMMAEMMAEAANLR
ncbi:hypothetical protein GCM10010112_11540 [Actinoplanes lobatus]|uniref:PilZ domain-containing protein n=1 Tax=Actinoplanes lobatus TaxID=113568 RepID=A0A7W7MG72_9ACTN|nr:hypothetical protein [Actinoplanes lobatus]MBB4748620.1 hypothetical protein [Actinoplanes lobatus]GGN58068.1 hypothetical protein GCM10010112_11540 [Actinoplanes lobatus]GIE37480.1 hypothetical protein Alo02nite_03780 [Actinoplanes lobatus]